jgi:hypothetical protein
MHVALLANTAYLDEELTGFRRLVVGLLDEQVRVTRVVPEGIAAAAGDAFSSQATFKDSTLGWVRRHRLARLTDQLAQAEVELLHALDGRMWEGTLRLGMRMNVPVVLGAMSAFDVPLVRRVLRQAQGYRVLFTAATQPLGQALAQQAGLNVAVEVIAPGVHVPETVFRGRRSEDPCLVVSGNGVYDAHYEALLGALHELVRVRPPVQVFFDGQGVDPHALWQAAGRFALHGNISLIPRRLGHRELLLGADALIHPQPLGRMRSLTLAAMAAGVPVLAQHDPWLDYLLDDQTAWVVQRPSVEAWLKQLQRVVEPDQEPEGERGAAGRELGLRARQWVSRHRIASQQVERTLAVYRQAAAAGAAKVEA